MKAFSFIKGQTARSTVVLTWLALGSAMAEESSVINNWIQVEYVRGIDIRLHRVVCRAEFLSSDAPLIQEYWAEVKGLSESGDGEVEPGGHYVVIKVSKDGEVATVGGGILTVNASDGDRMRKDQVEFNDKMKRVFSDISGDIGFSLPDVDLTAE